MFVVPIIYPSTSQQQQQHCQSVTLRKDNQMTTTVVQGYQNVHATKLVLMLNLTYLNTVQLL